MAKQTPGPLPVRLNRRSIYILPTRHGLIFLIVLFAMLVGSINYSNNLGFLLVFLLGSVLLVSILHTWRNLLGLTLLSVAAEPVFAGEAADFEVLVRSRQLYRKSITCGFEKETRVLGDIFPGAGCRLRVPATPPVRGRHTPGRLVFATRFPLGLFRAWSRVSAGAAVLVYPRPIEGQEEGWWGSGAEGAEGDVLRRGPDDFIGLKAYQPGDAIRHIAWKTLSRGQGVFTKDFRDPGGSAPVFDYREVAGEDAEERLSRLSGLVLQAERAGLDYGLALPGVLIPPSRGASHRHACLRSLALFEPGPGEVDEAAG